MYKKSKHLGCLCRDAFIILIITSFLVILAESLLRVLFPDTYSPPLVHHDRYIYTLRPNNKIYTHMSPENGGKTVVTKTNRWGFRGKDIDVTTDYIRVMVYGDSNIQAAFSECANTFVELLEKKLNIKAGRKFEVINAGVEGFGPDQALLRIEDEIGFWNPDLIIVHIFAGNDFGDILRNKLFRIDSDENLYYTPAKSLNAFAKLKIRINDLYFLKLMRKIGRAILGIPKNATNTLPAVPKANETELDSLFRRVDEAFEIYEDPSRPRKDGDHYDLDISLNPNSESSALKIHLMDKILERIIMTVAKYGNKEILFIIQPSSRDISTNMELNYQTFSKISKTYDRRNLVGAVEKILQGQGADYVSLFDVYVSDGKSPYYFALDDNHWNDAGQNLAGELVSEYIQQNYDFSPPH